VQTTTVEEQRIEETRQQQLVAIVEVRTRQQQALQDAEVTVINANATSLERIIDARAAAEALTISVKGQETSLIRARDALGFSNAQLLEYLQVRSVLNSRAQTRIAVPQPEGTQ
jgi:Holliday junction resolvase-like predicted endonuclease